MSNSFFGKLKDKVNYKLNEVVDDPDARKFAEKEKKAKEKELEEKKNTAAPIKEVEKSKEEKEQEKVWDFLKQNGKAIEAKLVPMIESYSTRLKEAGKSDRDIQSEKDRMFAEALKVASKTFSIDEVIWAVEDQIDKAENPAKGIQPKKILKNVWRNVKRIVEVAFVPFVSLIMASLISNEMIVYPAPIRFAFFLFTFIICILSQMILVLLVLFYLCKWGYHYYVNEMSDGPKRIIMPSLFAVLPLTTTEYSNRLLNFLARPFQYGEKWSKKDGEELKERMEMYNSSLNASFPFIETIKSREPYDVRLKKIEKNSEELHRHIPLSLPNDSNSESSSIPTINNKNKNNSTSEPPLPPVIRPLPASPPTIAEPATTPPDAEPTVAEPPITPPPDAEPTAAATTEPVVAEPVTAEPPAAEPATTEPVVAKPATTEPPAAEPAIAEPPAAEPVTAEPAPAAPPLPSVIQSPPSATIPPPAPIVDQ